MTRLFVPTKLKELEGLSGSFRAGGTDLQERRRRGLHQGDLIDLAGLPELDKLERRGKELQIGARVSVARLAEDPEVRAGWPGLAAAAGGLANPAIRQRATVAGDLLQAVRCAYYRHPDFTCHQKGAGSCAARQGDLSEHVLIDAGPCAAPHPSTLAVALLCWEVEVEVEGERDPWTLEQLLGDGKDPRSPHALPAGRLVTGLVVQESPESRSAWVRVAGRRLAEWPLVEVVVRLLQDKAGVFTEVRVAAGGIANRPLRLQAVEQALTGQTESALAAAAAKAAPTQLTVDATRYKAPLLVTAVEDALRAALATAPAGRPQ